MRAGEKLTADLMVAGAGAGANSADGRRPRRLPSRDIPERSPRRRLAPVEAGCDHRLEVVGWRVAAPASRTRDRRSCHPCLDRSGGRSCRISRHLHERRPQRWDLVHLPERDLHREARRQRPGCVRHCVVRQLRRPRVGRATARLWRIPWDTAIRIGSPSFRSRRVVTTS